MPIIKSAKKRVKIATKANVRNSHVRRQVRDALKAFAKAVDGAKPAEITKAQKEAVSALDTAVKKAIIHKNKAARQKSQLSAQAKAVVRQSSPSKTGAKPAVSSKPTLRQAQGKKAKSAKAPAKKPAAKKAPAKKPA